jgi:AmiR/NasT family two-component response regulator
VAEQTDRERAEALEAEAILKDARIAELVAEVDGLHKAMEHRAVIDQAKGVIMSALHCGPDAAFAALVARSQRENRKVWEIAVENADAQDDPPSSGPQPPA